MTSSTGSAYPCIPLLQVLLRLHSSYAHSNYSLNIGSKTVTHPPCCIWSITQHTFQSDLLLEAVSETIFSPTAKSSPSKPVLEAAEVSGAAGAKLVGLAFTAKAERLFTASASVMISNSPNSFKQSCRLREESKQISRSERARKGGRKEQDSLRSN